MKTLKFALLIAIAIAVVSCNPAPAATPPAADEAILTVQAGEAEQTFTLADLQAMPATEVESDDGAFVGVSLSALLAEAGFELDAVSAVSAVAVDGFSSSYDTAMFTREDAVLAYARADGDLNGDEQPLRMVIPGEEGRMQPRQVNRIEVTAE